MPLLAQADTYRIATWAAPLSRDGPGLLLRDLQKRDDPQIAAVVATVIETAPDVLVLTNFDYDLDGLALNAFADSFGEKYPYRFARRPNSGMASSADLDQNGRLGEARDAQGYGLFAGDGGMAILSRFAIAEDKAQDFSDLLWKDLPGATLPKIDGVPFLPPDVAAVQRLSTTGHWVVPINPTGKDTIALLVFAATPPVFDGPEDRNGLRNRDELRLWQLFLKGSMGPVPNSFIIAGNANLDPTAGAGFPDAMATFLRNPRLQDPLPGLPTAEWPGDGPGRLRVSYVLPSSDLQVTDAGVHWPAPEDGSTGSDGPVVGPHRLVWVDISR